MSAKIEAGNKWIIEKHDFNLENNEALLPSGYLVASPAYNDGHLQVLRLFNAGSIVEIFSHSGRSIVRGHLPWEVNIKGQVQYSSLSPKYGSSIFVLEGPSASAVWRESEPGHYLKVGNLV